MKKTLNCKDLDKIIRIEAKNWCGFVSKIMEMYPEGIDMDQWSDTEKQKFKAKEWSYSVCGKIEYNDPKLICNRCKSRKVTQLINEDVFMRMCDEDKSQRKLEIDRLKHMGLFIVPSPTGDKDSKDFMCLDCGNEW